MILQISSSWVAGITGMSHCTWLPTAPLTPLSEIGMYSKGCSLRKALTRARPSKRQARRRRNAVSRRKRDSTTAVLEGKGGMFCLHMRPESTAEQELRSRKEPLNV
jgi:hypothetical protein